MKDLTLAFLLVLSVTLLGLAADARPEKIRAGISYYSDEAILRDGVQDLADEKNYEEVYQSYSYYEAIYDQAERVIVFIEYRRGDIHQRRDYRYGSDGKLVESKPAHATEAATITPSELRARRDSGTAPVVIDVRTAGEYAVGHIPGAVNIPFDQVADRISEVAAPNGVALYCMVGPRARKGEAALLAAGYASVLHIEGGLAAWQAAGYPVAGGR